MIRISNIRIGTKLGVASGLGMLLVASMAASQFINDLLKLMVSRNGSDLFITAEFPPAIKVDGKVTKVSQQALGAQHT